MLPAYRVVSFAKILVFSLFVSTGVLGSSLLVQWLVYDDWLHRTGPLRIVGASITTVITFAFVFRWQYLARLRRQEMMRRFEAISGMSDRIRNALQIIACISFVREPELTQEVRQALDVIDKELRGVLREVGSPAESEETRSGAKALGFRKSA